MGAEEEPRKELLGLVRSLAERVRLDGDLRKPLCYLSRGKGGVEMPAAGAPEPSVESFGVEDSALDPVLAELGDCRRCPLGAFRHRLVFGEGNPRAELVFVGEAPGADEDAQGRPFVGRAGQLLTKIISAMGLKREDVYICNILKCRPPGNRNPLPDEIAACEPFLIRQIEAIRPRVVCTLG
ncbi:MAG: uracil-DNA glycosylase, partial [Syntrophaceae bacterium]|nr:uracil-DNA glycosylase [Syntrophaceae bacterium]